MTWTKDIGAFADAVRSHLLNLTQAVESGVEQNGAGLDTGALLGDGTPQQVRAAKLVVDADAVGTITGSDTVVVAVNLQHSPDDGAGSPAAFVDVPAGTLLAAIHSGPGDIADVTAFTLTGGGTESDKASYDVDLSRLERHVRAQITATFTGAGDECRLAAYFVTGHSSLLPVDAATS